MKKNTKIKGVGTDIVEIARIQKALKQFGLRFYQKILTKKEIAYCLKHRDPSIPFAGRFSAKEAIVKALGIGIGEQVSWLDIEITHNERGCPFASFSKRVHKQLASSTILLSISHCKTYATATAIWIE